MAPAVRKHPEARPTRTERDDMADPSKRCSVEGCPNPFYGRGLCNKHWQQERRMSTQHLRKENCSVNECPNRALARGLCMMHYQRWQVSGDPGEAKPRLRRGGINTKHPLYARWRHMMLRCTDSSNDHYADWGGRGITVCERWADPDSGLEAFVTDMGMPPGPEYSIDRIDNDGPYSPENCRWATALEQTRNRRKGLRRVRVDLLFAAAAEVGINETQIRAAVELALNRSRSRPAGEGS